jgi:hypothetical protein
MLPWHRMVRGVRPAPHRPTSPLRACSLCRPAARRTILLRHPPASRQALAGGCGKSRRVRRIAGAQTPVPAVGGCGRDHAARRHDNEEILFSGRSACLCAASCSVLDGPAPACLAETCPNLTSAPHAAMRRPGRPSASPFRLACRCSLCAVCRRCRCECLGLRIQLQAPGHCSRT